MNEMNIFHLIHNKDFIKMIMKITYMTYWENWMRLYSIYIYF